VVPARHSPTPPVAVCFLIPRSEPAALGNNTSGFFDTAIGVEALRSNTTGSNNTAIGDSALSGNTTGSFNTATG